MEAMQFRTGVDGSARMMLMTLKAIRQSIIEREVLSIDIFPFCSLYQHCNKLVRL